jgi:hypothetical protein
MRFLPVLCLLCATLVWGQQERTPVPSDVPPEYQPPILRDKDDQTSLPASASKVTSDAAVITINGLCKKPGESSTSQCQTVITRAQFEKLTNALLPNMKPSLQRQIANAYPELLGMAQVAETRGIENSPRFQERLAFARIQILSQELVRQVDDESAQIPEADISAYYHDHGADFETVTMERIFVPRQSNETDDKMTRVAESLRARATSGESFLTLQKDAYMAAGKTDVPPNPSLGQVKADSLPANHVSVLAMKPGEISKVLSDASGHYIYKLDTREVQPFEKVKGDIHRILQSQRREQLMQQLRLPITTQLNSEYFGPNENPGNQKSK